METQLTFEDIGLLDEKELSRLSEEFGDGYGGYSSYEIFDRLLPAGYSLKFIEALMGNSYLCLLANDGSFAQFLAEYKESPIDEWDAIRCVTCGKSVKRIHRTYRRVGKYLNEKGDLIKEEESDW